VSAERHGDKGTVLFRSGLLDRAVALLEEAARERPEDVDVGIRLVDAYRARGNLREAAGTVARLTENAPSNGWLQYLHQVLSGEPVTPGAVEADTLPAAFVLHDAFLPEELRDEIWTHIQGVLPRFARATIARRFAGPEVDQRVDGNVRRARTLSSPPRVAELMDPYLRGTVEADAGLLGVPTPQIDHVELEVAVYGDGDHFQCHQDIFEAVSTRRVLTFVYFFAPEPRGFSGGELLLYDADRVRGGFVGSKFTRIDPVSNRLILFDPATFHEVTPIRCASADPRDQRYTATGWVHERRRH
jgi:predicted 2-oxoglutarate/Fe(II)-dependent dioxygenase YbiX